MAESGYAREVYEGYRDQWRLSSTLVGDYGKWLIAQLTLIHVGAIFLLASNELFRPALAHGAFWWFIAGIMLSLLCGLATWFNWGMNRDAARVLSVALRFKVGFTYWLASRSDWHHYFAFRWAPGRSPVP
jgi:hypothetical protein